MEKDTFEWCGYEWVTRERWGVLHPEKPWALYSQHCVSTDGEGNLVLDVKEELTNHDGSKVFPMGLVSSTKNNPKFHFGTYTFVAKLPKGRHLWPALWMWSWEMWPPELDVMEAWTNKNGKYGKCLCSTYITNCVHYDSQDSHDYGRITRKRTLFHPPHLTFNEYRMDWGRDAIRFFFNGKKVGEMTDRKKLEWVEQKSQPGGMNVIMNLYPTKDYKDGDMKTPLVVKSFKYESKN